MPGAESKSEENNTDKYAALRASSGVLKYSFSFLAFVLFGSVIAGAHDHSIQ